MAQTQMTSFGELGITEAQIDMLDIAESFCRDKSPMDRVRALIQTDLGYDVKVWDELVALGWLGIAIPEDYEGVGLSMTEVVPVAEQMGRYMMASPFGVTTTSAQALLAAGTDKQKSEILPKIVSGSVVTLALSEPKANWELGDISTTAKRDADGFVLNGAKTFVPYLANADWVIVSAMLDGTSALFCFPADLIADANMRRETLIDETQRTYSVTFDDLRVTDAALMDPARTAEALGRIHLVANLLSSADMTGACQSCIDYTVEYLKTRKQFGKLIGSFQALKHPTVDAFVDYQKARSLTYAAAYSFDNQGEGEVATRMAKAQSDKALSFAADRSIQFHGGFGFTYDCDAQLYRRRALFQASQFGDARYHKKKLAKLIL